MTPEDAAKKYIQSDGTVKLPPDIIFTPPKRNKIKNRFQGELELRDKKLFIDGVESGPNRAARRAK